MSGSGTEILAALDELVRGGDPDHLREAVEDFLATYGEARTELAYGRGEQARSGYVGERARRLAVEMRRGALRYPFTDEGAPIVPGARVRCPDGSSRAVARIELLERTSDEPCVIWFDDGTCYRGRIKGFKVPRGDAAGGRG